MNTHTAGIPLSNTSTVFRAPDGVRAVGVTVVNSQPIALLEIAGELEPSIYYQVLCVETGQPIPTGAEYFGNFVLAREEKQYIQVAGSPGMTEQPQMQLKLFQAYFRECPEDEIPAELIPAQA